MQNNPLKQMLDELAEFDLVPSPKVHESFKNRWIPLRHTGVPSRVFHAWKQAGLVAGFSDSPDSERERIMLTIPEYLWVKLIQVLRSFGVNYPQILEAKRHFFKTMTPADYINLELDKLNLTDPLERELAGKKLREELSLDTLIPPHEAGGVFTHFSLIILLAQIDISFRFLQTGQPLVMLNNTYMHPEYAVYESEPYLCLSLNKLLFDLLADPAQLDKIEHYELLTEEEVEVIKLMRSQRIKRIEIKFEDSKPLTMEWTESQTVHESEVMQFVTTIKKRPYVELNFKNNNNKTVYVEQTVKKRLKR